MTVTRVITYDGPAESVDLQLGSSMNDGAKTFPSRAGGAVTITVTTLPTGWRVWRLWQLWLRAGQ